MTRVYLDASAALAHLLSEDECPPEALWREPLTSSRLIQYEMWTTLHARGFAASHGDAARTLLDGVDLVELSPVVLTRALDPFPRPLRTLDALHLATVEFLRASGAPVRLATYDRRMRDNARRLKLPLYPL